MHTFKRFSARTLVLVVLLLPFVAGAAEAPRSTADHSKFEELQGPFATAPDVTRVCLGCHTEAAKQLHRTTHWTWEYHNARTGQLLGKRHEPNVYCGSIISNWGRCTSCHIGYGWKDASFDFSSEENVDCLVCHDTSGGYKKFPTGAGHPLYEDREFKGKLVKAPDLVRAAQSVGPTSRATCGACHFYGGGGNGVKHGDLDSSMAMPDRALDVHMDTGGLNFSCATCHTTDNHDMVGSRYAMTATDHQGVDIPGREDGRASCESCHGDRPHGAGQERLDDHTARVACQTCHIPAFARGGVATVTYWDWSTVGRLDKDGKPIVESDAKGNHTYVSQKGSFEYGENVEPEYFWFDGSVTYQGLGERFDPMQELSVNRIGGSADDPNSRIWPFKVMRGRQPYDRGNDTLVVTHMFGKDPDALWVSYDWRRALRAGMAQAVAIGEIEKPFSGEYGFVQNRMYWPITHMVAPKEQALGCAECHARDGRLSEVPGIYIPGRDRFHWLDLLGWLAILATLAGIGAHVSVRALLRRRAG